MKNIFGYTLTGILVLIIAAVPIGGLYTLGRSIYYTASFEKSTGVVETCASKTFRNKWRTRYAPVIVMEDGTRATSITHESREGCFDKKGKEVSLLINPDNRDEVVVNTFSDMWMMPLLLLSVPGIFLGSCIAKRFF
jgi:hypothetical protein